MEKEIRKVALVLVVDDEQGIRDTLGQFLKKEGHRVKTAPNADLAVQILGQDEDEYDVVITDIILPRVSGVELLNIIRKASPFTKVILITGEPTVDTASQAVRAGAFDYLSKPISRRDITKTVESAIKMKQVEDDNRAYRARLEGQVEYKTQQLELKERHQARILDALPDVICEIGTDGRISYANQVARKSLGLVEDNLGVLNLHEFVDKSQVGTVVDELFGLAEQGADEKHCLIRFNGNGKGNFIGETSAILLEKENGKAAKTLLAISRDVTERLAMQKQIELEHEKLISLLNNIEEMIYAVDPEKYERIFVNRNLKQKYGRDITGEKCYEALMGESSPCSFCSFARLEGSEAQSVKYEYHNKFLNRCFMASDGMTIWPDGRKVKVGLAVDVTSQKQAEQRLISTMRDLARSNSELEQFAYVASHDLQEPLRKIKSYTELLERKYKDQLDERAEKYIAYAVDGAERMQNLIMDLLSYSRVGTRGKPFSQVDVKEMLERVQSSLQLAIKETGASITIDAMPSIKADPTQVEQLFQNLISNAIKFRGDKAPEIHISMKRNRKEWVFSVSDNGIGIDPEHREKIFVIFQRLHGRTEYPGTGIGLAICKKIVDRHGGKIWIESNVNSGSTFYFSISIEPKDEDDVA